MLRLVGEMLAQGDQPEMALDIPFFADSVGSRLSEPQGTVDESIQKGIIRGKILSMFQSVDSCEWYRLPDYFNEDAVYTRQGYSKIRGLDALHKFYAEVRVIASGRHEIERVYYDYENITSVNVIGSFHGLDRQGRQLAVRFCDAYLFRGEKISLRETYFNSPAV